MLGVELVTDRKLKTPANVEILHIMDQMKGLYSAFSMSSAAASSDLFILIKLFSQRWEFWLGRAVSMGMFSE